MVLTWLKEFTNGRELIRPGATKFATSYLTLRCLNEQKGPLLNMFTSTKWRSSSYEKVLEIINERWEAQLNRPLHAAADWWDSYGDECPELKKFAIRVLSLTCSSSSCERNWSAFEMVHTKKRNRLHAEKMNDLVFSMDNLKLKQKQQKRASKYQSPIVSVLDDLSSDDEWITEIEEPLFRKMEHFLIAARREAREALASNILHENEGEINQSQNVDVERLIISDDDGNNNDVEQEFEDEDGDGIEGYHSSNDYDDALADDMNFEYDED
ncbi:hypothetical protein V2J09_004687 [Rumex salicifolius]